VTLKRPLLMQAGGADAAISYSALDMRALITRLFHDEGIVAPDVVFGTLKVTQRAAGANFSVDIAAGAAAIKGDDVSDQGFYVVESNAVENRVIPSPPVSGTRVHRVVARIRDRMHVGSWTDYEWVIEVLEDTGAGTPVLPPSAISLARVSVAAGQTSVLTGTHITDDRVSASLISAKFPIVDADASRPPNPYESEMIWRFDKKDYEVFDGTTWRLGKVAAARKTAPESLTSNTGFQDDDHLSLPVVANATYQMSAVLKYEAGTTGDLKTQWVGPAGASLVGAISALIVSAANDLDDYTLLVELADLKVAGGRGAGSTRAVQFSGILVTAGTAGTFKLQWAQNTSDAVATILHTNSWLMLQRVA
jgi:hypothetical protein